MILGIIGSPRKNSFSEKMMNHFVSQFEGEEIEVLKASELKILPCSACEYCRTHKVCKTNDEMTYIYKKIERMNVMVISSPIYFLSLPGHLKVIIDRCQPFWWRKKGKHGWGVFFATCDVMGDDVFTGARLIIKSLFSTLGLRYFGEVHCISGDFSVFPEIEKLGKKLYNVLEGL